MPATILGLPLHPLVVHATVVLVPLTALLVILTAVSPRVRVWAGPLPLVGAVISTILAPISTSTGENLEHSLGESKLIEEHAELGDMLVWFCLGMLVVAGATWFLHRRGNVTKGLGTALAALGVVAGAATMVQVVLIGHSGAKAVWAGEAGSSSGSSSSADGGD
ncbi:DUF2231 domain-containing protein [Nocardioides marmoribigeumensis]|uniref:Membrane protein n=1 Tax=Nocardioides marmoribigeumensis TaxID=433649 RepID=A0ABU2BWU5_9ACTN|nr:DUF2231 domain-containing protein [Nocardioides marmoribigeumensis]MDR7362623.1 putative membrane protein [Nocardioides marmoribigeumensis]